MSKKITVIKICETCKKGFVVPVKGRARQKRRFCSYSCVKVVSWLKGTKGIAKPNKTSFKKGGIPPHKGKKLRPESIERIRVAHLLSEKGKGKNHYNWKGGITSENHSTRTSVAYRKWRQDVFKRDNWTCVAEGCGYRSRGSQCHDIRADHIKPFHLFPKLRLVVSNGRTLCISHDKKLGYNYHRDKKKVSSNVK